MFHLPKVHYEWAGFLFFWFGGLWLLYFELFFVSPYYYPTWNTTMWTHLAIGLFCAFNIYANMFMMITTDTGCQTLSSPPPPNHKDLGWFFCAKCDKIVPPRSHHCKICNVCILKRDHHCFFSGYCVGYFNQRYFIAMCAHMLFAAFYCNVYNWQYFIDAKGGFAWTTIFGLVAPHMGLMLGYYSLQEFILTAHTFTGFFLNIMFITLMVFQIQYCLTGQTNYERKKEIKRYCVGFRKTMKVVLGSAGFWVFLCPFIPSTMDGNGSTFPHNLMEKKAS